MGMFLAFGTAGGFEPRRRAIMDQPKPFALTLSIGVIHNTLAVSLSCRLVLQDDPGLAVNCDFLA